MRRFFAFIIPILSVFTLTQPALADGEQAAEGAVSNTSCSVCGLCPSPFGICLFLFLIAALAVAVIILLLLNKGKRCPLCHNRCKKDVYMCTKCGYDFDSGLQSTMAIRVSDSPELMALRGETVQLKTVDVPVPGLPPVQEDKSADEQKAAPAVPAEEAVEAPAEEPAAATAAAAENGYAAARAGKHQQKNKRKGYGCKKTFFHKNPRY